MERPQKSEIDFSLGRRDLIHNKVCDEWENFLPDEKELRGLVAQGYCTDRNAKKVLDPDLLEDIVSIIFKRLQGEKNNEK